MQKIYIPFDFVASRNREVRRGSASAKGTQTLVMRAWYDWRYRSLEKLYDRLQRDSKLEWSFSNGGHIYVWDFGGSNPMPITPY